MLATTQASTLPPQHSPSPKPKAFVLFFLGVILGHLLLASNTGCSFFRGLGLRVQEGHWRRSRVIAGLYRVNGNQHGNYYLGV